MAAEVWVDGWMAGWVRGKTKGEYRFSCLVKAKKKRENLLRNLHRLRKIFFFIYL
jgi:hypothetical protein